MTLTSRSLTINPSVIATVIAIKRVHPPSNSDTQGVAGSDRAYQICLIQCEHAHIHEGWSVLSDSPSVTICSNDPMPNLAWH